MKMQLTNNFYTWAKTVLFSNTGNNLIYTSLVDMNGDGHYTSLTLQTPGKMINILGEEISSFIGLYQNGSSINRINGISLACFNNNNSTSGMSYSYFKVGLSNKEASTEDIELDEKITENVSYGLQAMHSEQGLSFLFSVTNTSAEEIQIGEIGFYKDLMISTSTTQSFLLGRYAFPTKMLIAPNQTRVFEILIEI